MALKRVDPRTLPTRVVEGLSFAGEILDLDGPSGGYNLQWAFASGNLAGMARSQGHPKRNTKDTKVTKNGEEKR